MKSTQPTRAIVDVFTASFRQHVRLLIAWGLELAIEQIRQTDQEEHITSLLFDAIDEVLRAYPQRWCKHYDVHNERPISNSERLGHSRREVDLIIKFVTSPFKPEYVFEAKPLNYAKYYQREGNYIHIEALQRFIKGEYAEYTARYPEVGMLGYVLSDTPEVWRDRLKLSINNNRSLLRLVSQQNDIEIIPQFPCEWISEHQRESSTRTVKVYHLLLNCRQG
jgi:hypothetical protein